MYRAYLVSDHEPTQMIILKYKIKRFKSIKI